MCGIAGIIAAEPLTHDMRSRVTAMSARMVHRGPDGQGSFHHGPVAMAMRRLSVIDLDRGQQPLFNEEGSVVLIANGEIYNYIELREQLRSRGHQFKTGSDCEPIVHLYEEYGAECVQHLRGMFAFALWDSRRRRLMLARDRMGEKPLYLYHDRNVLYFSSELKGLMASGKIPFEWEPAVVDLFFHYNYVPEPLTPIRGVRKLPAAHILTIDADTWEQKQWCYWRMEDAHPLTGDPIELIRHELEAVGKLIVRSDVPVGVALSGGLDSSALAALAARNYPGVMQAFTVGYAGNSQYDEREEARAFAQFLGMPFHEVQLYPQDVAAFFPELTYWLDDPIGDISAFGYYSVMKAAKAHGVSVMFQGHGGDELFWGYPWMGQAAEETQRKLRTVMTGVPKIRDYIALAPPAYWSLWGLKEWAKSGMGIRSSFSAYRRDRSSPPEQAVFYDLTPDFCLAHKEMTSLYSSQFAAALSESNPHAVFTIPFPRPDVDVLITQLACRTYLLENGIAQGDRLSMASSVELRLPFVDYRFVETVIGLRKVVPDHTLTPKCWLRQALTGYVPEWVLNRPKRGFTPPLHEWHSAIFAAHGSALADGVLVQSGVLQPSSARELARGSYPPGACAPISFKALTLELWCRAMAASSAGAPSGNVFGREHDRARESNPSRFVVA